jgi:hypothetical protein
LPEPDLAAIIDKDMKDMDKQTTFCAKGGCAQGKGLLVIGGPDAFHDAYESGYKSHKNRELRTHLNGLKGVMSFNRAKTCKVLRVGFGNTIHVGTLNQLIALGHTKDQLQKDVKNGKAWVFYDTNGGGNAPVIITTN